MPLIEYADGTYMFVPPPPRSARSEVRAHGVSAAQHGSRPTACALPPMGLTTLGVGPESAQCPDATTPCGGCVPHKATPVLRDRPPPVVTTVTHGGYHLHMYQMEEQPQESSRQVGAPVVCVLRLGRQWALGPHARTRAWSRAVSLYMHKIAVSLYLSKAVRSFLLGHSCAYWHTELHERWFPGHCAALTPAKEVG